jgi:hypothetical protein
MVASTDNKHLNQLAILHWIYGGLSLLGIVVAGIYMSLGLWMVRESGGRFPGEAPPPEIASALSVLVIGVCTALILVSLVQAGCFAYSGRCLWRRRQRMFSMIMGALAMLWIPLGTALGAFTLVVLCRRSVQDIYRQADELCQ